MHFDFGNLTFFFSKRKLSKQQRKHLWLQAAVLALWLSLRVREVQKG